MSASSGKAKHQRADSSNYTPVYQDENDHDDAQEQTARDAKSRPTQYAMAPLPPAGGRYRMIAMASCIVILVAANLYLSLPYAFAGHGYRNDNCPVPPEDLPQYFRTSPNLWPGPTATGAPAFLAQTRVFDPTATFVPNEPLQTSMPIEGMKSGNESIFRMMAFLSPYFPSPGFGVDEYPLPDGAEIVQVQMLSRHGSRYPTAGSDVVRFGEKVVDAKSTATFKGVLGFLQDWKYELGSDILVPKGRQELYDSGVLHNYMYGKLYDPNSKIIVRTTTQDRMLKSAENWLAGFFGLDWRNNATVEVLIEGQGYNNSLAGYLNCPNSNTKTPGYEAPYTWVSIYLKDGKSPCWNSDICNTNKTKPRRDSMPCLMTLNGQPRMCTLHRQCAHMRLFPMASASSATYSHMRNGKALVTPSTCPFPLPTLSTARQGYVHTPILTSIR